MLAFASSYDDQITPEHAAGCHRIFGRCAESLARPFGSHANTPDPDRRIRLGLLSAELREHSNSFFLLPILENLDKDRFELVCYHTSRHEDAVTAIIRSHADRWVACDDLSPADLARRIHTDRVDVLIELTGHFGRNRLVSLAAWPAPVQVTYLGYGNTTGLRLSARLIDDDTDPAPAADALASEPLVRLGRCFLAYRPPDAAPEPGEPDRNQPFTFASFNDIKKLSPAVIALWSRILGDCPGSRLLLKTGELTHTPMRDMIAARFAGHGVDTERIVLRGRVDPASAHLAMYDEADLGLDTFPYAGTTTTCEALWQGVPVLTLAGGAHAGRVGISLLRTVGMEGHIADDEDDYIRRATEAFHAGKPDREHRLALRARVAASPLLDHAGLTRSFEHALRTLWRQWCDGRTGANP
jgi:predicted O-linked N-acetylglucosamine transferase (SPINDLY family)